MIGRCSQIQLNKYKLTWDLVKNKRAYLRPIVYEEYEEQHRKKSSDFNIRNSLDALKSKFLKKFHLFNGILKQRGHGEKKGSILTNFEEEVVNVSDCNLHWPIWLYDFLYQDRIAKHFAFKTQNIQIVEDYFGDVHGDNIQAKGNSELSFQKADTNYDELLIERNPHICRFDNLENKFKTLFSQEINEFFLSVIHLVSDDPFDELTDNTEKIRGFIEIWDDLISRHNLPVFDSASKEMEEDNEPKFFDEFNNSNSDSDQEDTKQENKCFINKMTLGEIHVCKTGNIFSTSLMSLFDLRRSHHNKGISISRKIRYYRRSQSVIEPIQMTYFDAQFLNRTSEGNSKNGSFDRKSKHYLFQRTRSWKAHQMRKIISAAQTFRIESRFNKIKIKRKNQLEKLEAKLKTDSGLQKLRTNAMDLMFMEN
jgi:hypothetical protein